MTDEKIEAILKTVRLGLHPDRAAQAHGVAPETLRSHRKRHPQFATAIKEAEAAAEQGFLGRILRHTENQWTAAAWMLERRWPDRWAKREPKLNVQVAQQQAIQVGPPMPEPEQLRNMLAQLSDRLKLQIKNQPKIQNK